MLDVKNTRSINDAVRTVKCLLPQSAGTCFFDAFIFNLLKTFSVGLIYSCLTV